MSRTRIIATVITAVLLAAGISAGVAASGDHRGELRRQCTVTNIEQAVHSLPPHPTPQQIEALCGAHH